MPQGWGNCTEVSSDGGQEWSKRTPRAKERLVYTYTVQRHTGNVVGWDMYYLVQIQSRNGLFWMCLFIATSKRGPEVRIHDWYLRQREVDAYGKYKNDIWQGRGIVIISRSSMLMVSASAVQWG